jgi:hypothetical protein
VSNLSLGPGANSCPRTGVEAQSYWAVLAQSRLVAKRLRFGFLPYDGELLRKLVLKLLTFEPSCNILNRDQQIRQYTSGHPAARKSRFAMTQRNRRPGDGAQSVYTFLCNEKGGRNVWEAVGVISLEI